jgi:dihydroneopterin aldolase
MKDQQMPLYNNHTPKCSTLRINELRFQVRLGCTSDERATPQEVRVSVEFKFETIPLAASSDSIDDTICYAKVSRILKEHLETREFNMIERIGGESFILLREFTKQYQTQIGIQIHKVHPPIPDLINGAHFLCGDFIL